MSNIFNTALEKPSYTCAVCEAEWTSKKKEGVPQRCPRCKSKLWNTCYKHHCCKCSYDWLSASPSPDRCPKCQSKKWQDTRDVPLPMMKNNTNRDVAKPVLLRYDAGVGCIRIAADLKMAFSDVYDIVKQTYPNSDPRL